MKKYLFSLFLFVLFSISGQAQTKSKKISYYGGFGLSLSTDYTYLSFQPGLIYNANKKFKLGAGVQYTYLKSSKSYYGGDYSYNIFGFNTMALYYPVKGMEMSLEYEDLYVKEKYNGVESDFWSPSLFAGMGYRYGPMVVGFKYNFLYDEATSVYQDAFIPFVRIYF